MNGAKSCAHPGACEPPSLHPSPPSVSSSSADVIEIDGFKEEKKGVSKSKDSQKPWK